MLIGIIPARGGSKRLPRKNIKPLLGKSLIRRAVERALAAKVFSRLIVSTDDPEIADEALSAGAEVPFLRPAALATDQAGSVDVLCHAVGELLDVSLYQEAVICLMQPTSPMVKAEHIQQSVKTFNQGSFTSLSTMTEVFQYPEWTFSQTKETGLVHPRFPEEFVLPGSQLKKSFIENGAVYLVKADWLMAHNSLYDLGNHGMFLMSRHDSIDIDTSQDWELAEFFLSKD